MDWRRILIVDDDKVVLAVIKSSVEYLLPDSYITAVEDGTDALAELQEQGFDLILTDYNMPHMNGLDLAQAALKISSDTHIVLMTAGYSLDEIQAWPGSVTLGGFLAKPFTMLQLNEILFQNGIYG